MSSTAETIAAALGGRTRLLPGHGSLPGHEGVEGVVIELPDGRMPVLVRDFGHMLSICVGEVEWRSGRGGVSPATVRAVIESARAWAEGCSAESVTLYAIVQQLAVLLSDALGQRWEVFFPGVPGAPREARLNGPEFYATTVQVFGTRVLVSLADEDHREFAIGSQDQLTACGGAIVAAVREQLAAYERNLVLSEAVRVRAEALAGRIGGRLGIACRAEVWLYPTHERASEARILSTSRELARVFVDDGEVRVHAGLPGKDGWEGRGDEAELDSIVAMIEREAATLTIDRLRPGHRYRVIRSLGELRVGMIVRFVGIDDIDNHYGIGEFIGPDGQTLGVPGDYSTPRASPLGPAYRYLSAVED